ncbi:MAG: beta-galactosidase, partial [Eubacteriales bacterium]|nr:beta-galactosidase [Eubacteriales bacterium]
MRIGVDYYPEHWERSRWDVDAQMMKEAGIQVVRLAEFAWSLFEPNEGEYHFEWLDEVMDFFA